MQTFLFYTEKKTLFTLSDFMKFVLKKKRKFTEVNKK